MGERTSIGTVKTARNHILRALFPQNHRLSVVPQPWNVDQLAFMVGRVYEYSGPVPSRRHCFAIHPTPPPVLMPSALSSALVAISVRLLEFPCLNQWPSHPKVALFPKWKAGFGVRGCVLTSNPRL